MDMDKPPATIDTPPVPQPHRGFPYRVLVVDDDPSTLYFMTTVLEEHFEVVGHPTAHQAFEALHREVFHLVVADWQMPEMDGVTFFRKVTEFYPQMTFLLVTGHVEQLAEEIAWTHRSTLGLLRKPFDMESLVNRCVHLASLSALHQTA